MTLHTKRLLTAVFFSAVLLLTACGPSETKPSGSTSEMVWSETDTWPDNEFTQSIPLLDAGTPVRCAQGTSTNWQFFVLELIGLTSEDCRSYLQTVKDAGFSPVSEIEEEISPNSVSIASVYQKDNVNLNLAYSSGSKGIILYISKPV